MPGLLVLWDVDYTLVNAGGLGTRLYQDAFLELYGRELPAVAPKAGRTDRAIAVDTLSLAGIPEPRAHVDSFLAELARRVDTLNGSVPGQVRALPGAADALAAISSAGIPQSVLTGNIRPLAEAGAHVVLADLTDTGRVLAAVSGPEAGGFRAQERW